MKKVKATSEALAVTSDGSRVTAGTRRHFHTVSASGRVFTSYGEGSSLSFAHWLNVKLNYLTKFSARYEKSKHPHGGGSNVKDVV